MKKLAVLGLLAVAACSFSEGDRAGIVSKLSNKGLVCKSWEGQLVMGGTVGNVFEFSVRDPAVVAALQQKMDSGVHATVHYVQNWPRNPCKQGSSYLIVSVN